MFRAGVPLLAGTDDANPYCFPGFSLHDELTLMVADLVLLKADPLENIPNTSKISEVFLAGKEFDRAALDHMLATAEAAAKTALPNDRL
jgi:hypothetical protein